MSKELEVAIEAVQEAGKILIAGWETGLEVTSKANNSLVTKIDKQSEDQIIQIIKQSFPDHSFVGEEGGSQGSSNYCWYIDPIDGTTNYSRRIPLCAISIGLVKDNQVIVGVISNPFTNELFTAELGKGSFLNGKKIASSNVATLKEAVISMSYGHAASAREMVAKMDFLITDCRTTRANGSIAYEMALIASGRFDAAMDFGGFNWDYAAGSLLIKEAGGLVTDFNGQEWRLDGKEVLSAGNSELQKIFLEKIAYYS